MSATPRHRRRIAVAAATSVVIHLGLVAALVLLWAMGPAERLHHGSYVLLSDAPSPDESPTPHRADALDPAERIVAKARAPRAPEPPRAAAAPVDRLPTTATPELSAASLTAPTSEPGAPSDEGAVAEEGRDGEDRSLGVLLGDSGPPDATDPSPECLDGRDNDGDRLIDHEDPQCWPELPEPELVSKRTGAMLLSDMRSDDLPRGDPDELARMRIESRIRPDGDSLVYRDGSFVAHIGPDGEVSFARARSSPLRFDLGGGGKAPGYLQRKRFLDATAEIRAEREERAHARRMKLALVRLGPELNHIWQDGSLSLRQKKRILFERLDECDLESAGGREAARIIIDFIRAHFRSAQPG